MLLSDVVLPRELTEIVITDNAGQEIQGDLDVDLERDGDVFDGGADQAFRLHNPQPMQGYYNSE